jgi:hypothetical protein
MGSYEVVVNIKRLTQGAPAGTSTYTGTLNCGGVLTYQGISSGVAIFDEAINQGRTCPDGRMELMFTDDGKLIWQWFRKGFSGQPTVTTTLKRQEEPSANEPITE